MAVSCSLRHDSGISESEVCAVIVTFNAVAEQVESTVRRLSTMGAHVVLIENGSEAPAAAAITDIGETTQAEVIKLSANLGIAAAQNIGIQYAVSVGASFVLLLDHDSLPAEDMVRKLLDAHQRLTLEGIKIGAVGPVSVDSRTLSKSGFVRLRGVRIARQHCGDCGGVVEADFLIASGSLISIRVLQDVGGMNEGYFIDHVDTEWCLRARERQYRIFGVCDAALFHNLGERVVRIWFGRIRELPVHSPIRNYYIFRNTVLMLKSVPMPFAWRFAHIFRLVQFMTFFVLAVSPRGKRLKLMARGILDGLHGREGPLRNG
ncbi:glycosyltransferase family 2 protein [Cupriavidus basilensis]|uniref:glycosyltransferase family 2 protein n=1 Tax=Cupriavidus basilensis TaxID=68895 RepID=UPI0023E8BE6E|nr:glycosyltransferase family 2 protein [Cupriavidus basilensis]MDF3886544.1 glycosyltransferase family 2 protein [Cupriavidus basilensis]